MLIGKFLPSNAHCEEGDSYQTKVESTAGDTESIPDC